MTNKKSISELNLLPAREFAALLGGIFEYSPWVAEGVEGMRPFAKVQTLHAAMAQFVAKSSPERQLALIKAHPDLAGRLARQGELTSESTQEQAAAGLGEATPEALQRIEELNAAYRGKFDFPFIICARLNKVDAIIDSMEQRLLHTREEEITTALEEISKIAKLRLDDLLETNWIGKITTHVLDTAGGRPAQGIEIVLHRIESGERQLLTETSTNSDGRTDSPLLDGEAMKAGIYEITFHMGAYYQLEDGFLDAIPLRFRIGDPSAHYHVPLLCTPWSYSTYRGS